MKITSFKHETRSESTVVCFVERLVMGITSRIWETYRLGTDNPNVGMYLEILGSVKNPVIAYNFLVRYGELLYSGPNFKKAMAKRA